MLEVKCAVLTIDVHSSAINNGRLGVQKVHRVPPHGLRCTSGAHMTFQADLEIGTRWENLDRGFKKRGPGVRWVPPPPLKQLGKLTQPRRSGWCPAGGGGGPGGRDLITPMRRLAQ